MFDLGKLGDLSKVASQAQELKAQQEDFQRKQLELLQKILSQLQEMTDLLKARSL